MLGKKEKFLIAQSLKKDFFEYQSVAGLHIREQEAAKMNLSESGKRLRYFTLRHLSCLIWYIEAHFPKWNKKSTHLAVIFLAIALEEKIFQKRPMNALLSDLKDGLKQISQLWIAKPFEAICFQAPEHSEEFFKILVPIAKKNNPFFKEVLNTIGSTSLLCFYEHPPLWLSIMPWNQTKIESPISTDSIHHPHLDAYYLKKNSAFWRSLQEQGEAFFQNIASQEYMHVLCNVLLEKMDLSSQIRILDTCAAPGGKSLALIKNTYRKAKIHIDAFDIDPQRAAEYARNIEKTLPFQKIIYSIQTHDWTTAYEKAQQPAHCVLVDAPCSGSGVIRKHPDILWRNCIDLNLLQKKQLQILNNTAKHLTKNGILAYSTCSILNQENSEVIALFLQENPQFHEISLQPAHQPSSQWKKEQYGWCCLPSEEYDGFYFCFLEKSH